MQKGLFTQGIAVLLSEPVPIEQVNQKLAEQFTVGAINDASGEWAYGGVSFLIPLRTEVDGYVMVDVVDRPWPDEMGHPQDDPQLYNAWSMGQFGPFTFPGNLERAAGQLWGAYPDGDKAAKEHKGFIRIRTSYVLTDGANADTPVVPEQYDPMQELIMITAIARKLLSELPQALCYFNPAGECLAAAETVNEQVEAWEQGQELSVDIWSNIRLFVLPQGNGWVLMDTVGMWQLDVPDHEALFIKDDYDPNEIADFLRNISLHLLKSSLEAGVIHAVKGPGDTQWQGEVYEHGVIHPPRQVVRWYPKDHPELPVIESEIPVDL